MNAETYAACGHGLDEGSPLLDCWSCIAGIGLGPELPPGPPVKFRYGSQFVEQYRQLSGDHRFPLRAAR